MVRRPSYAGLTVTLAEPVGAQQRKRHPDAGEPGQPGRRYLFAKHEHSQDELDDRGEILEQADDRQRYAVGGHAKGQQWGGGDGTGGQQQQLHADRRGGEVQFAGDQRPAHAAQGEGYDRKRLRGQGLHGAQTHLLFQESIGPERCRQPQADPGHRAVPQHEDEHRHRPGDHRRPLQRAETLVQHEHAEQHGDQWVDEVTQRGVDHPVVGHRPHVDQPVGR